METVSGRVFQVADLMASSRSPGLAAFMRIRNGADFLETAVRSHIGVFDEIVAVYNQCTDRTPEILARLEQEFAPKFRVYHYTDRVFPPGSTGHAATPPSSPSSMVNYSNVAMALTTRRTVTKLDDDHLAIPVALAAVTMKLRHRGGAHGEMLSFSGLNLFRGTGGVLGIPALEPFSGSGDIGFFDIAEDTVFTHDARFERVPRVKLKREFSGFLYWHLKYLKTGLGFANYELESNPDSRFARREAHFSGNPEIIDLRELKRRSTPGMLDRAAALLSEKKQIQNARALGVGSSFPEDDVESALRRTIDPAFLKTVGA